MTTPRKRMTWAALEREAAAPPAIPGYGVEDQDHPAHTQDDPEAPDYMIGGPSEFAEDVHPGPYGDSGAPAIPGYGVEDQDHPAHQGQVGRKANLMGLVRKKASKALKLAQATLGKKASWDAVEDQAFSFMSMDDEALDASLGRLSGGFLAEDEGEADPMADFGQEADGDEGMEADFGMEAEDENPIMARMKAMEEELLALKRQAGRRADQNDPAGETLGTSGKSEDEEKKEETAVSNKSARTKLARLFTACDMDQDGFVTEDDWMGPPALFAALDTDRDGILAKHEVLAGEVPEAFKKNWDKDKDEDKDEGEDEKKSSKKSSKKSDDEDVSDEEVAAKKAHYRRQAQVYLATAKKADEDVEDEDEAAAKKAYYTTKAAALLRKAKKSDDEIKDEIAGKKAGKKSDDEGEDEDVKDEDAKESGKKADKKAFGHFAELDDDELDMLQAMQYGGDDLDDSGDMTACSDPMAAKQAGEDESETAEDESETAEDEDDGADKEASFFTTGFDPMGLADGTNLTAADKAAFEEVFGKQADDESEDESEDEGKAEEEDEGSAKEARKLASLLRPQPRKASQGVKTVGTVAKTANGRNEVNELSSLWASDPDVSGSFS